MSFWDLLVIKRPISCLILSPNLARLGRTSLSSSRPKAIWMSLLLVWKKRESSFQSRRSCFRTEFRMGEGRDEFFFLILIFYTFSNFHYDLLLLSLTQRYLPTSQIFHLSPFLDVYFHNSKINFITFLLYIFILDVKFFYYSSSFFLSLFHFIHILQYFLIHIHF